MSLISLGYIFTYYFLLISSYSLSHFFSRQALRIRMYFMMQNLVMKKVLRFLAQKVSQLKKKMVKAGLHGA
ncbi:hypothetical protein HUB92_00400 [Wolbachia endosymbiont of Wiebesia pumilae]|uniref:hypothetical protein n=1 Tax=Wolbachia endosymbiont of Wiebesia pumilae TaxID=2742717 RepID=UPI001AE7A41B|nr:hypothetical protein [Wolbachia endosymbiont of Wiebesia pumilae]QTP61467.1 hypothetical protein HUB92_00400 [Wolbachia endosymbiont of Wiebesia pumilae]